MHSWRKTLIIVLIILFVDTVLLSGLISLNYLYELKDSLYDNQRQTTDLWEAETEDKLNGVAAQLHQFMITVYTDSNVSEKATDFTPVERKEYKDMMNDILSSNRNIDAFYMKNSSDQCVLFVASPQMRSSQITAMRNYIDTSSLPLHNMEVREWNAIEISGNGYFIRNVLLGRYQIGVLCNVRQFDIYQPLEQDDQDYALILNDHENLIAAGGYDWRQDVTLQEDQIKAQRGYLLTETTSSIDGIQGIIMTRQSHPKAELSSRLIVIICFSILLLGTMIFLTYTMTKMIYRPTNILIREVERFGQGNLEERITDKAASSEFDALFKAFNEMADQIQQLKVEVYEKKIKSQQEELMRLRSQIRPHFYLNAITTVSNLTYAGEGEKARKYLNLLAKYMRYMMKTSESDTTLGDELDHIRNYLAMQEVRIENTIYTYIGCPKSLLTVKVPYLLIFTIVENCVKHALDPYSTLQILIQCEHYQTDTFTGTKIIVEDNGKGFSEDDLISYNDINNIPEAKEHIGLSNVIRTLYLTYGRKDLFSISNSITGGAHVQILIPNAETDHQTQEEPYEGVDM